MRQSIFLGSIIGFIFIPSLLLGHSLWLEKQEETLVLRYGHNPNTHAGEKQIVYSPDQIVRADCFKRTGEQIPFEKKAQYPFEMDNPCQAAVILTSSGYWSKTPFGLKALPKDEAISPLESWLSYEGVKRMDAWDARLAKPLSMDLEITPTNNPLVLKKGKKVRLLVTFKGIPVANVPVAYDGKTRGATDKNGHVNIRLKHGGLQLIETSTTEPGDKKKADKIIRSATLVFEIK
ncbi:hypothetical protein BVX98_01390 [bacterium F11]|nr:hypothetical protein BVX98_01390 [bacterium F11]